jgi:hypothetical protein
MIGMRRFGLGWGIGVLVLLVLSAAAVGWLAYNAGVQSGLAQSAAGEGPVGPPGYWYGYRPFGFGFGWLGCLVIPFLIFLFFGLMRSVFFPWRMGMWGGPWGRFGRRGWRDHYPQEFDEWHRKAHGTEEDSEAQPRA